MTIPFFSIIIPTYNSSKTLKSCIESVLKQSFADIELVIVDGLSTDTTISIAQSFTNTGANVRFITEKDKGIYDAMNKGIAMAKGEWLYFLGSDDTFYNINVLKEVSEAIKANPDADVIYGNVFGTSFNGVYGSAYTSEKIFNQNISHQAIFFNRGVFNKVGNFNLRYKALADWDHNMRWFFSKKIKHIYIDTIITDYAEGGFSAVHGSNDLFYVDKCMNYISYGHHSLAFKVKWQVFKRAVRLAIKQRNYLKLYAVLYHLPYLFF